MYARVYHASPQLPVLFRAPPTVIKKARSAPEYHGRLFWLLLIVITGFTALGWRLWQVQVVDGEKYTGRLAQNSEVSVRIPPVRGEIRDRNGVVLAENRSSFNIEFYLPEMVRAFRKEYGNAPVVDYLGRVHGMAKLKTEADIVDIVDVAVIPRLRALGLPTAYDREELVRHFRVDTELPFVFVENADFKTVAKFSEHDIGLPGVRIAMHPIRHYVYGALAAHVLGYVGEPQDIGTLTDARDFEYYDPNVEGKAQIEGSMDRYLRGSAGARLMQRGVKGSIERELRSDLPHPGNTVYLTLDARIQFLAEEALRSVGRAAAVVVDPNNGDILAMASVPSFDPNTFIPSIPADAWKHLLKDPTDPLVNRAICAYPPGSTFKIVTSLAGLRQGLARLPLTCSGGVSYGDHYFQCWYSHGHGRLTLSDAIKMSCNAFFYQYGNAAGIDAIDSVGTLLGLGQTADIGLSGEQPGILPGPEWMKIHSPTERWSSAQTANVSIGQGYDLVSPLQLVMAYSTVANGGTAYYPRLVKAVTSASAGDSAEMLMNAPTIPLPRGRLRDVGIAPEDLALARQGFWRVVNEDGGTARRARLPGGIVAGKTGTAQAQLHGRQDTIAWFVCFAPFNAPRYAIAVMVQGGAHGGSVAAPIAARILEEILAMDAGSFQPVLAALAPARHRDPFRMIDSLDLAKDASRNIGGADDEPGLRFSTATASEQRPAPIAEPRLRRGVLKEAPDRGIPITRPPQAHRNVFDWLFHSGRR